ncbi:MAG: ATP-grasp domain-containing protein [Clostridiales bacterium]|jgi:glutathione synthase/RimK-type ligase-like ATP-grasp enzyme|nr:ATP-grasp domain-containing protein [Clostridiales bacterium]
MNYQIDFINEICAEENIRVEKLSHGYVLRLNKNEVARHIFGSYWDMNSAASDRIACDKTACSNLLIRNKIPAIIHELLYNPLRRPGWAGKNGAWARAAVFFKKYNQKVVLKPNQGTKGQDIFLCTSMPELEAAAQAIFANYPDAALSPYREIQNEYRVFFLNGNCCFAYGKAKGDSWQHNLSQGAVAFELSDNTKIENLNALAIRAANCIGISFSTIDIAESPNGELAVMEINSGVQARQLLEQLPHLRPTLKKIYKEAVFSLFAR